MSIKVFTVSHPVIGMVHLAPLPGSSRFRGSIERVYDRAREDAATLADAGVDGLLVENYGDAPFHPGAVPPVTVAVMATLLQRLRAEVAPTIPWGVNVLRNDAAAAIAVAAATGAAFIRVNVHLGAMVTDQGVLEGRAHDTLRLRQLLAPEVAVFADVHVKHGRPLAGASIEDDAADVAHRGLADAVLVTGSRTGLGPAADEVRGVAAAAGSVPVFVASGVTAANAAAYLAAAGGLIVGTALKRGGRTENPIDPARARAMVEAVRSFREGATRSAGKQDGRRGTGARAR